MLTHINEQGQANMVDVTDKRVSIREAVAQGCITMLPDTLSAVINNQHKKGDVIATARIAGIQGAKKCADLIPLCHPLALTKVDLSFDIDEPNNQIIVSSLCKLSGQTGVEMEALTAVSIALLTLFDMCKAMDPMMEISAVKVLHKIGGESGFWTRDVRG
ncbi:cyclic pyranopterin monophosphate synthase MoaC [Thalassotalea marina]|uniref:Cyclic pyranopterin monophosphate synthase n=1 Tax=Thalassotalea marina TaxID=1673741 RepID=A0A919EKG3_9GAMM|nr:cyclic pyranopterin monophosphate synthase MoaC [Thalassotalea marina]GHF91944.1 cyclic pyranopterin monophosphate synthase accessory protein [Thalassotalea marina]